MKQKYLSLALVLACLQTQITFTQESLGKDKELTTQQQKQKPRGAHMELLYQIRTKPLAAAAVAAGTTLLAVKVYDRFTGKENTPPDQEVSNALVHSRDATDVVSKPGEDVVTSIPLDNLELERSVDPTINGKFNLRHGKHAIQGRREEMEDAHCAIPMLISDSDGKATHSLHGIFDGHGGSQASELVSTRLPEILKTNLENASNVQAAIAAACSEMEKEVLRKSEEEEWKAGTTAAFTVVHDNTLYIANIGDSRAVFCKEGTAYQPLKDHNPKNNKAEGQRVKDAGGKLYKKKRVAHPNFNPMIMNIAVSRSLGDKYFKLDKYTTNKKTNDIKKSGLIATPEIHEETLTDKHEFVILACDGVWDVLENQEAVDLVRWLLYDRGASEGAAAAMLVQLAHKGGSMDNITAMVIKLSSTETE